LIFGLKAAKVEIDPGNFFMLRRAIALPLIFAVLIGQFSAAPCFCVGMDVAALLEHGARPHFHWGEGGHHHQHADPSRRACHAHFAVSVESDVPHRLSANGPEHDRDAVYLPVDSQGYCRSQRDLLDRDPQAAKVISLVCVTLGQVETGGLSPSHLAAFGSQVSRDTGFLSPFNLRL
jgi:hypothetical protein